MTILMAVTSYLMWLLFMTTTQTTEPVLVHEEVPPQRAARKRPKARTIARQYAGLTRLGHPRGTPQSASFPQVKTYEKQRARSRAAKWQREEPSLKKRCAKYNESQRTFVTTKRKDFDGYISEELQELGLCPTWSGDASRRVDFYMGEQLGLAKTKKKPQQYPWWTEKKNENASIGSIDGLMETFGLKNSYADLFWHCEDLKRRRDPKFAICPRGPWLPSFNINGDQKRRSKKFKTGRIDKNDVPAFDRIYNLLKAKRMLTYWIVKPQKGTWLSRGMHLVPLYVKDLITKTKFLNWISRAVMEESCQRRYEPWKCDRREVTFQLYVHTPALFYDRKFDLRVWVAITSLNPFRVYLLRHAYPKVASRPFDIARFNDQCRHIKMLLDPECNVTLREFKSDFPYDFPRSTASPVFFSGLRFKGHSLASAAVAPEHETDAASIRKARLRQGRRLLQDVEKRKTATRNWPLKEDFWNRRIWPAIETTFAQIALLARENLTVPRGGRQPHKDPRVFALLSPDVTLDEDGRLYVEEINTNGLMMGTHQHGGGAGNLFFDDGYVRDLFRLVGADDYPSKTSYASQLEDAIATFCSTRSCNAGAKDAIRLAVNEEAHAGSHWYRIYPPIPCFITGGGGGTSSSSSSSETNITKPRRMDDCYDTDPETGSGHWPLQAQLDTVHPAFKETSLDTLVRDFLAVTNTQTIHNVVQIPGHARWPPRDFDGTSSL